MNVHPTGAHTVTIHQGPAVPAAQGEPTQADPGAWRRQLATVVSERRGVVALLADNANQQGVTQRRSDRGRDVLARLPEGILSGSQVARWQAELDAAPFRLAVLQFAAAEFQARALGLQQVEHALVRHVTRHDVTQETNMPEGVVNLIVDYLADQDLPRPPLPAPAGS